ncbi:MAG: Peptidase M50 [Parcubacteria group bacterium GW2011_GWA2_51_10]|nr:MAG: Peptidase M50 [Parcubacteria group bacterium GW2011_GWA2_51_10]
MDIAQAVFLVAIIIMSAVIHEVMHGVAADKLGDPTARLMGRLTLNPISHLDAFGSVLLPLLLTLTNSPILFGWAKPVPYNPYNLRPGRFSEAIVAGAGPVSNLVIALIAGLFIRSGVVPPELVPIVFLIIVVNVMLFIFNLIPLPPLDGSKVLGALLPKSISVGYDAWRARLEGNMFLGLGILVLIILVLGDSLGRFIYGIARAIAGA